MSEIVLFSFLLLLSFLHSSSSPLPSIGVTYSAAAHATVEDIYTAISSLKITHVRILNSDPSLVQSFAFSDTSLILSIPNTLLPAIARNQSDALLWIDRHVFPFYPRSRISLISVGNAVLDSSPTQFSPFLLPAMKNICLALRKLGLTKIPISSTFSFLSTITTAFPPSSAQFQQPSGDLIMKPLLRFLQQTNSSFLINIYPYNIYRLNGEIPIGFALFQDYSFNFRDDVVTGLRYFNLFDMMVDAVITAMAMAGFDNIPVIVAETGWPSGGGEAEEVEANGVYAEMYLRGLVRHLKSGAGSPLRKEGATEVYIYELMDDNDDHRNNDTERKWGILSKNMTKKYNLEFSGGTTNSRLEKIFMDAMVIQILGAFLLNLHYC